MRVISNSFLTGRYRICPFFKVNKHIEGEMEDATWKYMKRSDKKLYWVFYLTYFLLLLLFKKNRVFKIQLIYILLSIAIGSAVSNFFLQISSWSGKLPYLF